MEIQFLIFFLALCQTMNAKLEHRTRPTDTITIQRKQKENKNTHTQTRTENKYLKMKIVIGSAEKEGWRSEGLGRRVGPMMIGWVEMWFGRKSR